jgi:hypothetical protein
MAAKNTTTTTPAAEVDEKITATVEQIVANTERAASLVEAENTDGLAELAKETEGMISSLPSRGRFADKTWAQTKKDMRADFKAASQAKEQPKPKAEVAVKAEPAPVKTYDQYEGVTELITLGAEKIAEGVRLQVKASTTAKEIASVALDMWRRIENKAGNPDIKGDSDPAKKASSALKKAAGEALARDNRGVDGYDVEESLKKLWRSVQDQRSDVRAEYLRGLDADTEDAAAERAAFGKILADKPDDVPASEWVAKSYGVSLLGQTEAKRLAYHQKQEELAAAQAKAAELTSGDSEGGEGEGEGGEAGETTTPDERVLAGVRKIRADIGKLNPADFETASDEAKEKARNELDELVKALKEMIKASI